MRGGPSVVDHREYGERKANQEKWSETLKKKKKEATEPAASYVAKA